MDAVVRIFRNAEFGPLDIEGLVDSIGEELFHYALALSGSKSAAEDAFQDLFVALLAQKNSLSSVRQPRSWLFGVLRIKAYRAGFSGKKESAHRISESMEADPAQRLILQEALESLSPRSQEIILLHIWQGLSFSEIADVLKIPRGTALSSYHRSVGILRRRLGEPMGHWKGVPNHA